MSDDSFDIDKVASLLGEIAIELRALARVQQDMRGLLEDVISQLEQAPGAEVIADAVESRQAPPEN